MLRGREKRLDNNFLKFLLMSPRQQEILASYATGTTVAGVSQKSLRSMPVELPSYEDQVAIGTLLAALNDKVDLNRRMNETLDAMARAIFKDWFVDFGPLAPRWKVGLLILQRVCGICFRIPWMKAASLLGGKMEH